MLILVGVTINVALNGGIFTHAQTAAEETQKEAEREQLLSAVMGAIGKDAKVDFSKLDSNLPKDWTGSNGTYTSPKGNVFTVNKDGTIGGESSTLVYEYTLAELITIAQESTSGGMINSSDEGIMMLIPYSEFWKGKELQGNETSLGSLSGCYSYNVTVENFEYMEIGNGSLSGVDRVLMMLGIPTEEIGSGATTDEYCMMIEVIGLTEEDDTTQIKIKISGEEVVTVAEPTTFTPEDLIDAGDLKENTGENFPGMQGDADSYYEMSVDTFNSIIGTDITKLSKYILVNQEDGIKYIRVLDNTSNTDLANVYNVAAEYDIRVAAIQNNKTAEEVKEICGHAGGNLDAEEGVLYVIISLVDNIIKVHVSRGGVNSQIDEKLCTTKAEIPESLLKKEIHLVDSREANRLINS